LCLYDKYKLIRFGVLTKFTYLSYKLNHTHLQIMESKPIASFSLQTAFSEKFRLESQKLALTITLILSILLVGGLYIFQYIEDASTDFLLSIFPLIPCVFILFVLISGFFESKDLYKIYDHSTLTFYTDKIVLYEYYFLRKDLLSSWDKWQMEYVLKRIEGENFKIEYYYTDIQSIELTYALKEDDKELSENMFIFVVKAKDNLIRFNLFGGNANETSKMQTVLTHLYEIGLNLSESNSKGKKTHLLRNTGRDVKGEAIDKNILALINELGKNNQAE
jgi:hypothetical protein